MVQGCRYDHLQGGAVLGCSVRPDWKFWPEPEPEPEPDCYDLAGTGLPS